MVVVNLSWYERFLNTLCSTNLYIVKGKRWKKENEETLKVFLREMEEECYLKGYEDGVRVMQGENQ